MYADIKYKDKQFQQPSHSILPNLKGDTWHREFAEYIYSHHLHGHSANFCRKKDFKNLRDYADANQDETMYMDLLTQKSPQGKSDRKSWVNISKDIFSVAPKFKAVVLGIISGSVFEMVADAIDEHSGVERENMKWNLWFETSNQKFLNIFDVTAGIPRVTQEFNPTSPQELNLIEEMGGFRLNTEIALEKGLKHINNVSDKEQLAERVQSDIFDSNVCAVRDYVDIETQEIKYEYIDPARLVVIGGIQDPDFKHASAYGYLEYYSIVDLRSEMAKDGKSIDEKKLYDIASKYGDTLGNRHFDYYYDEDISRNKTFGYDDFIIPVLVCEFASVDSYYNRKRKTKSGGVVSSPQQNKRIYDTEKKKTVVTDIKVWRRCKWIIGTEEVFDYGLQYDIPRPIKKEARSSFHVHERAGKSIMEQIIPLIDSMQMNWLKYQNLKATGRYSGVSIEWSSLQNMKLGGKKMGEMDILRMFNQTNVLIYKATTHRGHYNNPNTGKPVDVIPSGIYQDMQAIMLGFSTDLNLIQEITGINEVVAASDPNPKVGLGQSKLAISSSVNVLKGLVKAWRNTLDSVATNLSLRLQIVAKNGKGDEYWEDVIGKAHWAVLKMGTKEARRYGIKVRALPTAEERQELEMFLNNAIASGKDGKPSIVASEYFAIKRMLDSGTSIKFIQQFIALREGQRRNEAELLQRENMQLNSKAALDAIEAKKKAAKEESGFETDDKIRLEKAKEEEKRETMKLEYQLKEQYEPKQEKSESNNESVKKA